MRFDLPDAYWKKDVALFFSRKVALVLKMLYPMAIIVPVAASGMPAKYAAAVIGIVAVMAGTFGAGESLTIDLNDGILVRVALIPVQDRLRDPRRERRPRLDSAPAGALDRLPLAPGLYRLGLRGHPRHLRDSRYRELHRDLYSQLHLIARGRSPLRGGDTVSLDLPLRLLPQPASYRHSPDTPRLHPLRLHGRCPEDGLRPEYRHDSARDPHLPNHHLRRSCRRRLSHRPAATLPASVASETRLRSNESSPPGRRVSAFDTIFRYHKAYASIGPSGKGRRSYEQRSASVRDLGRSRPRRGGLLGNAGPRTRGDDQRRVAALRSTGILCYRLPLLRALHPGQGIGSRRFTSYPGRAAQQRSGLRSDGPAGALRAPLRGHSRGGAAGRACFGRADGLLARDDLDHRRRHTGRRSSGYDYALFLHAKRRQEPRADGTRGDRTRGRSSGAHRRALDHGDPACCSRPRRGQRARGIPMGLVLARDDHPHCTADGCLPAFPASGTGA